MTKGQARLAKFAMRYAVEGWQGYGRDRATVAHISALAEAGIIETNEHRQFRLALPKSIRAKIDSHNMTTGEH